MFDAGDGAHRQAALAREGLSDLTKIFASHMVTKKKKF
jgi:hypothetical protein